jgi:hypothetical protein
MRDYGGKGFKAGAGGCRGATKASELEPRNTRNTRKGKWPQKVSKSAKKTAHFLSCLTGLPRTFVRLANGPENGILTEFALRC